MFKKSFAVNISAALFYIALGIEFAWGGVTYACGMSSDLSSSTLNHVVFACGSIKYLSETVAMSEDCVMVKSM